MAPANRAGGRKAAIEVRVKRVYAAPSPGDGARLLFAAHDEAHNDAVVLRDLRLT